MGSRHISRNSAATVNSFHYRLAQKPSSSPASTAAPNGAARRSIRRTSVIYVNSNDIAWTGALAENGNETGSRALYISQCSCLPRRQTCWLAARISFAHRHRPPPQFPANRLHHPQRQRAACPVFQILATEQTNAIADFLSNGQDTHAGQKEVASAGSNASRR